MQLINKKIVLTMDIGVHGNLFGGTLMSWIDEAAGSFATEYCMTPHMVTLKVGELLFKKPLKVGNHVRLYGDVTAIGTTSITMNIEARKLNVYSGEEVVVCTTSITYVQIDDDGNPISIRKSVKEKFASGITCG
ncbi:MAG: acyl-CoA thioesterase [Crocinitomicaceae bacterium]|nr:acyl-CoA thioesterase [Crocinitomicaceae bacterium]